MRSRLPVMVAVLLIMTACADGAEREAKLREGSVDACALLSQEQAGRVLQAKEVQTSKGVLTQTWGSACRWSTASSDAFISVVVHTKHAAQTFRSLGQKPGVRSRSDLAPRAFQHESKIYLLKRGALVTVEWKIGGDPKSIDEVVRSVLKELDALAATQAVHR